MLTDTVFCICVFCVFARQTLGIIFFEKVMHRQQCTEWSAVNVMHWSWPGSKSDRGLIQPSSSSLYVGCLLCTNCPHSLSLLRDTPLPWRWEQLKHIYPKNKDSDQCLFCYRQSLNVPINIVFNKDKLLLILFSGAKNPLITTGTSSWQIGPNTVGLMSPIVRATRGLICLERPEVKRPVYIISTAKRCS